MLIDHLVQICTFFLSASLTLNKYALVMNPLARGLEEVLPTGVAESRWCFFLLRAALVISTVCVAFLLPFFVCDFEQDLSLECRGTCNHFLVVLARSRDGLDGFSAQHSCGRHPLLEYIRLYS
ncbi:hypothetical protein RJ641_027554 [Dillenia turbinata]|uniref:Uncharacterized protein n=1 Tax=Dillenia turbinata TaxID=194707 RepID=A0AAN8WAB6_9MAGN